MWISAATFINALQHSGLNGATAGAWAERGQLGGDGAQLRELHPAAELGDAIKGAELLEVALVGCHQGGLEELGAPDACVGIL